MDPSPTKRSRRLSLRLLLITYACLSASLLWTGVSGQLTFSKSWVAGGGKRSSSPPVAAAAGGSPAASADSQSPSSQGLSLSDLEEALLLGGSDPETAAALLSEDLQSAPLVSSSSLTDLLIRHRQLQDLLLLTSKAILKVRLP